MALGQAGLGQLGLGQSPVAASGGTHTATADLVGSGAVITGQAVHPHIASANIVGAGAVVTGTTDHTAPPGSHNAAAALVAGTALITGVATRKALHQASAALVGAGSIVGGQAYLGGVPVIVSNELNPLFKAYDWKTLMNRAEPKKPKHPTYEFSNRRQFLVDDDDDPYS